MTKKHPLGITVLKSKLDVVREIAAELGFEYTEESTTDCDDSVCFNFGSLSDEQTMKLVSAIPRDVYYFRAIFARD
jgi:hypothetical protein